MNLDDSFLLPEQGPFKHAQTQVDGRRVERIDFPAEFEDVRRPAMLGLGHDAVGELLKDAIVPGIVGLGQISPGGRFAEPQMIGLQGVILSCQDNVP